MNQPLRMSSAASLIVLGSMIAGCASQHAQTAARSHVGGEPAELGFATRALAAFNANNVPLAIDLAEKAVAKTPADATIRTLLGNAYFAAGRFQSAEAAYRDSLTLDSGQPQVILRLALVEIAQGKDNRAVAMLKDARGLLDASDYGLALALAGRSSEAIAILDHAARQPGADSTVRQNLALAQALAGNWDEARVIAGQDVPANQLDARMHQWMQIAQPVHAADQVAAVVGVSPAVRDPGQPMQLALNTVDPHQPRQIAVAPLQVTEAASSKIPLPQSAQVSAPASPPKPAFVAAEQLGKAAPVSIAAIAPASQLERPDVATFAASAVNQAVVQAKAVFASVASYRPFHAAEAAKPRVTRRAVAASQVRGSHAVVQLGAYVSPERVLAAWDGEARKYGVLKAYAPMSARFVSPKGTLYRLSVRGFGNVAEAKALCASLHHSGGACFVRNVEGDSPVNIALR